MSLRWTRNDTAAYETLSRAGSDIAGAMRQGAYRDAATAMPETIETQRPGAETTPGTSGMTYDQDTGQYLPNYLGADGQPTEQARAQLNATPEAPAAPLETVLPTFATETSRRYRMGDREQAEPFTPGQIGMQRIRGMSDIALRHGDPVQAAQFEALAAKRREHSDQDEIRTALAGGGKVPEYSAGFHGKPQASGQPMSESAPVMGMQKQRSYLDTVGPRVMDAYLKQGKVAEAKAWRDLVESEQGHAYANTYANAQRMVTAGDFEGAIPALNKLHSSYPDGRRAQTEHIGDGQYRITMIDEATGKPTGSRVMPAAELSKQALMALAPTKLVEFMAQQHGKREAEGATLNRQLELERLRQEGQDVRDDRREERLQTRLDAQSLNLERRLSATGGRGGLSVPQQRTNESIDAARRQLEGMDQADVLKMTQASTATGRPNPNYDPEIARLARLANSRKYGDDQEHADFTAGPRRSAGADSFAGKSVAEMTEAQLQQFGRSAGAGGKQKIDAELARRTLAGMPEMQGHQIGKYVEGKGYQVLDAQGRPVSYLRRRQ